MGRTKQSKDVSKRMTDESNRVNKQYDTYNARFDPLIAGAQTRANEQYGKANSTFDDARANYNKFLATATGFGKPEGYYEPNAENIGRMRGGGVFDKYANEGIGDEAKGVFRSRATSGVPAFYEGLRNELQRQRAIQGGVDPGYDAQTAKLARDQSQEASKAYTNAEAEILDRDTQARQWGASNMSDAERAVVDAIQRGRMYGGEQDYRNRALMLDANRGLTDVGRSYADLRGQTPGEVNMYEGMYQRALGQGDAARSGAIGQLAQYTPSGNWFDRNRTMLATGATVASAFMPWLSPAAAGLANGGGGSGTTGFGGGVNSQTGRPVRYYDPYFDTGSGAAGSAPSPYGYG
jgi:hypothetical protein